MPIYEKEIIKRVNKLGIEIYTMGKVKITKSEQRHPENYAIVADANRYSHWANMNVHKTENDRRMIDYCVERGISFEFRKPYFIHDSAGRIQQYFLFPFIFRKRIGIMFADSPNMVMKKGSWKVDWKVYRKVLSAKGRKLIILPAFDREVLDEIFGENPNWKTKVVGKYGI